VRNDCTKVLRVSENETVISADLGSSSNYSNEIHFYLWCIPSI